MYTTSALALALLPLAMAVPSELVERTAGNVYMCTGSGWANTCANVQFTVGTCTKLPSPFYHALGSAGADHGAHCVLFDDAHATCGGTGTAFLDYPGTANLYAENNAGVAGDFGHAAAYVLCVTCTAC